MAKKVLSIDDSQTDQNNIKSILVELGFSVITANNGREGVTKAKK